jgi:hypothetical protein
MDLFPLLLPILVSCGEKDPASSSTGGPQTGVEEHPLEPSDEEAVDGGAEDSEGADSGSGDSQGQDTGVEEPSGQDSGIEDSGTEASAYDPGISLLGNLEAGVPVAELLEYHEASEFYGLPFAGGGIFHLEPDGTGMVAYAPAESDPVHWLDDAEIATAFSLGSEMGTGEANTLAIVGALGAYEYAANVANEAEFNGYTDWFLPSIDELSAVYVNLYLAGSGGFDGSLSYWSSTDMDTGAWVIYFYNGATYTPSKIHPHHHVLPVRRF